MYLCSNCSIIDTLLHRPFIILNSMETDKNLNEWLFTW